MKQVKLHLGCGPRYLKGFIHIDLDDLPHIDYPKTDLSNLSMLHMIKEIYRFHKSRCFLVDFRLFQFFVS